MSQPMPSETRFAHISPPSQPAPRTQPQEIPRPVLVDDNVPGDKAERVSEGWRKGRPIEDPEKTKRWGYVSAKPSEYLIHMRDGRVLAKSSGQGATCFKRPRDAIAIVPTSLQRLRFTADQVTLERVGVAISGLAVFRIADPILAFRVLNFSYPERAQEKLRETIGDMLIGATRRLVANLSVNDCLQKRKLALADELYDELAPVVGGVGRFDDETDRGWGVVLDTIEIQEVRILSKKLFADMQAPYRTELARNADRARDAAEKEAQLRRAVDAEEIESAELKRERATSRAQAELEGEKSNRAKALALLRLQNEVEVEKSQTAEKAAAAQRQAEVERAAQQSAAIYRYEKARREQAAEQELNETRITQLAAAKLLEVKRQADIAQERAQQVAEADERRATLEQTQAERAAAAAIAQVKRNTEASAARLDAHKLQLEEQTAEQTMALRRLEAKLERERHEQDIAQRKRLHDLAIAKERAHIMRAEAAARAHLLLAEKIPELAGAVGQRFGEINITQIGGADGLNVAPAVDAFARMWSLAKGMLGEVAEGPHGDLDE